MPPEEETCAPISTAPSLPRFGSAACRARPPRMRVESNEPARFGRESPVLRHWVANSVGFSVEGPGCRGVVERVYGLPGAATSIAVRRRLRRRTLVPADHVIEVLPGDYLLVVGSIPGR